jgi:hypothetical protein
MYQVLGQIEPTNYSADIIRIEKEGYPYFECSRQLLFTTFCINP